MMVKYKSIFLSKTVWGSIVALVVSVWFAVEPELQQFAKENRVPTNSEKISLVTKILVALGASGYTIAGRVQADKKLFTPVGLPGPNKVNTDE